MTPANESFFVYRAECTGCKHVEHHNRWTYNCEYCHVCGGLSFGQKTKTNIVRTELAANVVILGLGGIPE